MFSWELLVEGLTIVAIFRSQLLWTRYSKYAHLVQAIGYKKLLNTLSDLPNYTLLPWFFEIIKNFSS